MLVLVAFMIGFPVIIISFLYIGRLIRWALQGRVLWLSGYQRKRLEGTLLEGLQRNRNLTAARSWYARGNLRARVAIFLYSGSDAKWGMRWDVLQCVLALLSCCVYIVGTYASPGECSVLPYAFEQAFELIASGFFTIDYTLGIFLATRRIRHVLSPIALAELLTILPVFLQLIFFNIDQMSASSAEAVSYFAAAIDCNASTFAFGRFLRLARFMRIVRLARFMRGQDTDSFWHHVTVLLLSITCIVLVSACTFQWAETINDDYELQFHAGTRRTTSRLRRRLRSCYCSRRRPPCL